MTISSIGSTTSAYQTPSANSFNRLFSDFKGIGSTIQSGDLTTAQSSLTAFENDLQSNNGQNLLSRLFRNNSTLSNDLQNLQTALQSNDPSIARNAFKTLIQDMQGAIQTLRTHHHPHRVDNDGDKDDSSFTSATAFSGANTDADSTAGSAAAGSTLDVQA